MHNKSRDDDDDDDDDEEEDVDDKENDDEEEKEAFKNAWSDCTIYSISWPIDLDAAFGDDATCVDAVEGW